MAWRGAGRVGKDTIPKTTDNHHQLKQKHMEEDIYVSEEKDEAEHDDGAVGVAVEQRWRSGVKWNEERGTGAVNSSSSLPVWKSIS